MIIAYHLIWGAYGFWLPNDPRGSWSDAVWAENLRPMGPARTVRSRQSLAHRPHDRVQRIQGKEHLTYPAVRFDEDQRAAIGHGFGRIVRDMVWRARACAVMSDHVHVVVDRSIMPAEEMRDYFKRAATRELNRRGLHPQAGLTLPSGRTPSPWGEGGWVVYLDTVEMMERSVAYVRQNPTAAGLAVQDWDWVVGGDAEPPPEGDG